MHTKAANVAPCINCTLKSFKVGTHDGTSPLKSKQYTKGLVAGTCPTNGSQEASRGTSRRNLSQKFRLV